MSTWTSLFLPLTRGLDLSKELVAGGDELHQAYNIDFGPDGSLKGRPSRAAFSTVYWRDPATDPDNGVTYSSAANFTTGTAATFTPKAMARIRDAAGERPAFLSDQRVFTHDGTSWNDNGAYACLKVDRVAEFAGSVALTTPTSGRGPVAPDFAFLRNDLGNDSIWVLMTSDGMYQREQEVSGTQAIVGMGSQVGTTTAVAGYCTFPTANALKFIYRTNGGALNVVTLATDCRTPADTGDAPCICPGVDGLSFLVAYRTTTANVFKVLKVGLTGTVAWTYTSGAIAGLHGVWVAGGGSGKIALGITGSNGFIHRRLDPSTGAATGSDATASIGVQGYDVVVGVTSSNSVDMSWYAYRVGADEDIEIGYVNLSTDTLVGMETFYGAHAFTDATLRWGICHQPVSFDGHTYLTLATAGAAAYTATWVTLDLMNWFTDATLATGPDQRPTVAACGPVQGTYPMKQPVQATPLTSGTGFAFPTVDWQSFALVPGNEEAPATLTGLTAMNGLNRVTISKPQVAQLGETVVLSGSVPRMFARGECWELGYPFLGGEPAMAAEVVAGGSIPAGTYSVTACWRWTDEAGQVHRSAPAPARAVTTTAGAPTIRCHVVIPWLTEKVQRAAIEVYCNSLAATDTYTLQTTTDVNFLVTETAQVINLTTGPDTSTQALYTNGGTFANYHVPGDGGVAAVGRRMWLAGADRVFASKLWVRGYGPEFSDEASADQTSLAVNIPAGAGRVVALEALDDKLVVFCARGVYLIQDGGPDNTGSGSDFAPALRISDLAIAGPRASCLTDQGVLFCSTLDTVDASRGGPWLVDRQFTFTQRQYLGRLAQTYFLRTNSWVPEVAYSPERQQAYITIDGADGSTSDGVAVVDFRHEKWATWDFGTVRSIAVVRGILWVMGNDAAAYSGAPGSDNGSAYAMTIKTSDLAANGRDGLGWSRVRSISPLQAEGSASHTLTITALLDRTRSHSSGSITQTTGSESTWPSSRLAPEWRLPVQKCSTLQVTLSATPAVATWNAIRLDVAPLPSRAPAKTRS